MTRHTLFVCTSCSATIAHDDVADDTITEGVLLLNSPDGYVKHPNARRIAIALVGESSALPLTSFVWCMELMRWESKNSV